MLVLHPFITKTVNMLRTHTCGELRLSHQNIEVTLCGWVQRVRDKGGMVWVDMRDRFGITQLVFEEGKTNLEIVGIAKSLGREFVIKATGLVVQRLSKNDKIPTGDIEIRVSNLVILNRAKVPPFTIEDNTDGGENLRMKYRYLDLRRNPMRKNLELRHQVLQATRKYMHHNGFLEVETPFLIKSTPEGARDFVVPSRMNNAEFYALPQSPQTFKQLLMIAGFDRYFQIVKCFRDEDLRADRQPEFTQIDCELSFVTQDDVFEIFEGMIKHVMNEVKGIRMDNFPRMSYDEAMERYGNDKPDTRFGMELKKLNDIAQGKGFQIFDSAELVIGICVENAAKYTRKQIDTITNWVKRPQIGSKGLVWIKCNHEGDFKSSVDKFYNQDDLKKLSNRLKAKPNDLILILAGEEKKTRAAASELRLKMGTDLGLRKKDEYKAVWVTDFPLLEWDNETQRYHAMHHPFTSPKLDDINMLNSAPSKVRANAYDIVINGVEIGGGSIRIHDKETQRLLFQKIGFSDQEAKNQFGFLMEAFEYGAPPHGGIAFGFDRLCSLIGGTDSIRDFIAFPKNNAGRDMMIDTPAKISKEQLKELCLRIIEK